MMEKRYIELGSYNTATTGGWTLASWSLSPAVPQSNLVSVPGRHGALDLSTVLTDGVPTYDSRTLTATLESSEGTRLERESIISTMTNWIDGWEMDIRLPDDPTHYIRGRVHVERLYNDPAHASVRVTATCDPWRYSNSDTEVTLTATPTARTVRLENAGRRTVVPLLTISGEEGAQVHIVYGSAAWTLSPGVYQLPDMVLPSGSHPMTYDGTEGASILLTYREAIL